MMTKRMQIKTARPMNQTSRWISKTRQFAAKLTILIQVKEIQSVRKESDGTPIGLRVENLCATSSHAGAGWGIGGA